jgi:hypothetical protein
MRMGADEESLEEVSLEEVEVIVSWVDLLIELLPLAFAS